MIEFTGAIRLRMGSTYIEMTEQSANPAAPGLNRCRLFVRDNGSGKTQLCVRFNTGAVQTRPDRATQGGKDPSPE